MAVYKIKRFSFSSIFKSIKDRIKKNQENYKNSQNRFYNPYENLTEEEILKEVKSILPKEYYGLLKVQDEVGKYRRTHKLDLDFLDLDVGFPDIYIETIDDIVKDLKTGRGYSDSHQYKVGNLDSDLYTYLYFDVDDKKWFFLQDKSNYVINLKQSIIDHYKRLLNSWLEDPDGWLDEKDIRELKEYTELLIKLIQRYL